MSERSLFWNDAGNHGGPYTQDQLRLLTKAILGAPGANEGVLRGQLNDLAVTTTGNNNVTVATGRAHVDGVLYENDASKAITTASPSVGTTGRRVVLRKDWASGQATVLVISSADGTASLPALTQTNGATWEIPLASFTITTAGVIGALTDERVSLGRGAWDLLGEVELAASAASVSFVNIASGYRTLRLSAYVARDSTSSNTEVLLRLNNDSGANYAYQTLVSSSTSVIGAAATGQTSIALGALGANDHGLIECTIAKPLASMPARVNGQSRTALAAALRITETAGAWVNTTDAITRVDLLDTNQWIAGTRVVLEGESA